MIILQILVVPLIALILITAVFMIGAASVTTSRKDHRDHPPVVRPVDKIDPGSYDYVLGDNN